VHLSMSGIKYSLKDIIVTPYALFVEAALRMQLRGALRPSAAGGSLQRRQAKSRRSARGVLPNFVQKWFGWDGSPTTAPTTETVHNPPEEGGWSLCTLGDEPGQHGQVRHFSSGHDAVASLLEIIRLSALLGYTSSHDTQQQQAADGGSLFVTRQNRRVVLSEGTSTLYVWEDVAAA
jgi:hypothetical protein